MKFQTVRIEGNTISADILDKISEGEYKGQLAKDFGFEPGVKIKDEIARAWADAQNQWKIFRSRTANLDDSDSGLPEVRKYWMIPFLGLLDYNLESAPADKLENGSSYPISHRETKLDRFPVYIVGYKDKEQGAPDERSTLDVKPSNATRRMSPHALVQEYVNLTEYAYGIVTNGLQLRLLRDSSRLVKLSFLEFDLEHMMEEEAFADFALLFRVLHASRLPRSRAETADSLIEQYHQDSIESGARIREGLSEAVEKSIRSFANGFLRHPANQLLRDSIIKKELSPEKFYQQQLRLIYRLLFLMVTEERNLVYPDEHNKKLRDIYYKYYSVERLRRMVDKRLVADGRYADYWEGLRHTFQLFEKEYYGGPLGIKPLNGDLFGINALGLLNDCALDNQVLLECIRNLTVFVNKNTQQTMRVNYASLNVEEFGSVYEGLLDYDPVLHVTDEKTIEFDFKSGEGRSSSGSHYTPEELVQPLIKHSLEYILQDKLKEKDREGALLSIKVCDVACGSGHILLSAARRIATEVARVRTGEDQPAPAALRAAIRDVIKQCIYGVDKNPLAVELCKVALWLESHNPGEPLGFLDHQIKCGDAIVGLAHREELEKGIADEAFKTLPGDDKDVAGSYLKKNKTERKEREAKSLQLKAEFESITQGNVQEAMMHYDSFVKLPERTPEEIEAKQRAYHKFLNGKGLSFLKTMADTQVAQFFIPKTQVNRDQLMTDAEFRQILGGQKGWQLPKTALALVFAQEQRFFHWFLEFPEVFQHGGFDCVMGNPPFLGGSKISTFYGLNLPNFLISTFIESNGVADFVTYFFKRDFQILKDNRYFSLITTDKISQGLTRNASLDYLCKSGNIVHAVKSMKWPGAAAVTIAIVSFIKGNWSRGRLLNGNKVDYINSLLEPEQSTNETFALFCNQDRCYTGVKVYGEGFVLSEDERRKLLLNEANASVIFPYLTGDDITESPTIRPSRYTINFSNWPIAKFSHFEWEKLDQDSRTRIQERVDEGKTIVKAPPWYSNNVAEDFPDVLDIVVRLVKPEREKVGNNDSAKEYWWQFERQRRELYDKIKDHESVLVLAQTGKYVTPVFIANGIIHSVKVIVFTEEKYLFFCFVQSSIYSEWVWKFGTKMGNTTLQFSASACFENMPFPAVESSEQAALLESIGRKYHSHRKRLLMEIGLGLTKTYNLFHSQYLTSMDIEGQSKQPREVCELAHQDILKLRVMHLEMDQAVLEAYGWQDIQLRHDFYDVDYLPENDRVRFTIHPEARKEILKRLLELNHKIHEEEVKAGLWEKKASKAKKEQKKSAKPKDGYGGLFD